MAKRSLALFPIIVSLITLTAPATASDITPQELVGKWYGPFEVQGTETRGDATVTIVDVAGTRVRGSIYMSSTVLNPSFNKELPFEGDLSGNTISTGRMTLTVDGSSMEGTASGTRTTVYHLKKMKK